MKSNASNEKKLIIDVKNLHKSFDGKAAVNGISVKVKEGEIFGFVGPNGCGKTTTIRMICGLLTPDQGSGTCLGFDIIKQSSEIKKHVGYMTQKFSLYDDLSIYENLDFIARMYGMENRTEAINKGLNFLGLEQRAHSQLAGTLSGGWKQRLGLSAAILHKPKLLLLDEPTTGIDPKARRKFWDEIHALSNAGVTTLISTQFMDEAERCHRLAYISKGKTHVEGTIDQVLESAKLITFAITGPNLEALSNSLGNKNDFEQVTNYGNKIHVSGTDRQKLIAALDKIVQAPNQVEEVKPDLEDVFIHYSSDTAVERTHV
jgi:ABC-2 type transport system ATP-binding protein